MDNPFYATSVSDVKEAQPVSSLAPRWFWPLTIMTFILGTFIAAALKTQNIVRREMLPSSSYSGLAEAYVNYRNTMELQQKTIGSLQKQNEVLVNHVGRRSPEMKELTKQLDEYRFLAGITPVQGPGIVVTLKDSVKRPPADLPSQVSADLTATFIIHDLDLQRVVNELRAAGAEAFAVNDQRVVTTTAIRCVGPAIQVNGVPLTPPYVIRAIGDPGTLSESLALPGGIAEQLRQTDPSMIQIERSTALVLPSYEGSLMFRYSHPVKDVSDTDNSDSGDSGSYDSAAGDGTQ